MKIKTYMRKLNYFKLSLSKISMLLLVFGASFSSCKKDDSTAVNNPKLVIPSTVNKVSDEKLIKFLSISLGVQKEEIFYLKDSNEFLIRNIRFNRVEMEDFYINANIYHAEYGE